MANRIIQFISRDIWRIRVRTLPRVKALAVRAVRILLVSIKEFSSDKCSLRASALTFYSLLSVVPVFAMAFGLAKGFGLDKALRTKLLENAGSQEEVWIRVIDFSEKLLQNTRGGVIAGIGLLFLFWTVIKVFSNIEMSFNDIWGVRKQRSWGRKFSDYLSLMLICPVFFMVASSATVFITARVTQITEQISLLGFFGPVIFSLLKLLPYVILWGLFTFVYVFMPNTKVHLKSALVGGVIAGTIYQLVQWIYIYFQIGVAKTGAIYGSFAALPLFLIWLQLSWLIVLYGAELAFAHQNEETFEFESDCLNASGEMKTLLALQITHLCVRRFCEGLQPLSGSEIAAQMETPIRLTRELLHRLSEAGVLTRLQGDHEREIFYQPARDVEDLTMSFVMDRLEKMGSGEVPVAETQAFQKIQRSLQSFKDTIQNSPGNIKLKNIV